MSTQILPLVEQQAVILNWSDRKKWSRWWLSYHVFLSFGGDHDFNPMIVLFRPLARAKVFRFHPAFQRAKHGDRELLERLREDLICRL